MAPGASHEDDQLKRYGWNATFHARFGAHTGQGWIPGRVLVEHRSAYRVMTSHGELNAELAGKLRHQSDQGAGLPVVGDWVALAPVANEARAVIHALLPRETWFSRKYSGRTTEEQVLAANIDFVFIVASLEGEFNARRLERYLTLAWESGAKPVVILNKVDLCDDIRERVATAETVATQTPIHPISALTGEGLESLRMYPADNRTVAFLGSSGVGKSTLINTLAGTELQDTLPVREKDQKGRHTTTHRELIRLPQGGLVIDTPGMREIHLWEGSLGVDNAFPEIDQFAAQCRFTDCRHETEPGCAVRKAIEAGHLEAARLDSYHKLQRELNHLEAQQNQRVKQDEKRRIKSIHRQLRSHYKQKRKDED